MFVEFEELPESSRVWVYTLDKRVNDSQLQWLESALRNFLEKWTAHGNDLKSGFKIFHDSILVIGLDEGFSDSSGCSIDASVNFLKGVGSNLEIDFFNRKLIPFYNDEEINFVLMEELRGKIENGEISGESQVFNTMMANVGDLKSKRIISVKESWLNRYLQYQKVS